MFYTLPKVRTNYGIFNIRFKGPKVWNSISENEQNIWKQNILHRESINEGKLLDTEVKTNIIAISVVYF